MSEINALQFVRSTTNCAARIQNVKGTSGSLGAQEALADAKVYVLSERRWFKSPRVQEVQNIGVTPAGDLTIVTIPEKFTSGLILNWIYAGAAGLGFGIALGFAIIGVFSLWR